ncbi:MAG: Secretion system C-terminal sorting domain [Bacteroidota bacterium]
MPTDTMYYRFRFISDNQNNAKEGWMISDISFSFADLGTGLEEVALFDFSIAPNPSNGLIEVASKSEAEKAILRDLNGNTVQIELVENKKVLNYSGLSKGMYFLQLQTSDNRLSQVKRLIID